LEGERVGCDGEEGKLNVKVSWTGIKTSLKVGF
jgi:hypothetical protein